MQTNSVILKQAQKIADEFAEFGATVPPNTGPLSGFISFIFQYLARGELLYLDRIEKIEGRIAELQYDVEIFNMMREHAHNPIPVPENGPEKTRRKLKAKRHAAAKKKARKK